MAITLLPAESRTIRFVRDWGPLLILIFTIGVAWATTQARIDQKLDTIRFVSDSVRRDAVNARQDVLIQTEQAEVREAVSRLSQLICYRSPNPACR